MSNLQTTPFGVLLVNLGTPSEPTTQGVRRYLAEFLWDQRVIQVPRPIWWLILHGIILRFRPKKVAKLYKAVWTDEGSPLLAISRRQQAALQTQLKVSLEQDIPVELAMTYGFPSIREAGMALARKGVRRIFVLPLYPQYSATTTAAVFDRLALDLKQCPDVPELFFQREYWQRPDFIECLARSVEEHWHQTGKPDRLLMSFHGIPQRYEDKGDPYPGACRSTAEALARRLNLADNQWSESFQSRFGREEWVKPYTDKLLEQWAKDPKIRRVDIICPAFAADCLETLEEIQEENKSLFLKAGGAAFHYIPCLNDRPDHIKMLTKIILDNSQGWRAKE